MTQRVLEHTIGTEVILENSIAANVFYQATHLPQTMKFVLPKLVTEESVLFDDPLLAARSPLASKLFGFPWCSAVGIGPNYVLVTKQSWVDWDVLADSLADLISEHLNLDIPVLIAQEQMKQNDSQLRVSIRNTPNPKALKFVLNQKICSDGAFFAKEGDTSRSPLAGQFLSFPWCESVFVGEDFVTLNRNDQVKWDDVAGPSAQFIQDYLDSSAPVLSPLDTLEISAEDSTEVAKIKKILNEQVRPGVAKDGGDIEFDSFREGTVYVRMRGSCSGCPSSRATLKDGIERLLKGAIPEILGVVQLA